jgi:hypothetical protein
LVFWGLRIFSSGVSPFGRLWWRLAGSIIGGAGIAALLTIFRLFRVLFTVLRWRFFAQALLDLGLHSRCILLGLGVLWIVLEHPLPGLDRFGKTTASVGGQATVVPSTRAGLLIFTSIGDRAKHVLCFIEPTCLKQRRPESLSQVQVVWVGDLRCRQTIDCLGGCLGR